MRVARSDIQHRGNPSIPSPLNDLVAVLVELLAINMAVGIN
jgi:hypothetical protein